MNPPAPITFFCVHCGTKLLVPVELAGETGPCPQCAAVITAPLVSNRLEVPAPMAVSPVAPVAAAPSPLAPVSVPPHRLEVPRPVVQEYELPTLEIPGLEQPPLDHGRPAGGVGGYPGAGQRRLTDSPREDFPVNLGRSRFEEREPRGSFPAALVSLLVVLAAGAGYLSWRMGFWGPAEGDLTVALPGTPAQIAKLVPGTVVTPTVKPVASFEGREPSLLTPAPAPASEAVPPGPQSMAVLAAETPARRVADGPSGVKGPVAPAPPISEPRLAVVAPDPEPPVKEVASERVAVMSPPAPATEESALQDRAGNVVRRFLEATSWKDRVGLIQVAGDPGTVLAAYYKDHPDLPIQNYRLDFFHNEPQPDGGGSAYIFFLTFANEVDGFPVMVLESRGEFRLDWGLFVEFRGRAFQRFIEETPSKAERFRVVLQRVTYWEADREEIPGVEQLLCYKIDPPYPGFTRFAFVDREKPIGKQLARELSWEADPLAAHVELKWAEFPGGKRYLTIEQLVSSSWVPSVGATAAQPALPAEN